MQRIVDVDLNYDDYEIKSNTENKLLILGIIMHIINRLDNELIK